MAWSPAPVKLEKKEHFPRSRAVKGRASTCEQT